MKFSLSHSSINLPDFLIVPVEKSKSSNACLSAISSLSNIPTDQIATDFQFDLKEVQTLYYVEKNINKRIVLLGLGKNAGYKEVCDAFRSFIHKRKSSIPENIGISFSHENAPKNPSTWVEAAINGMMLGKYDIGLYKTEPSDQQIKDKATSVTVVVTEENAVATQAAIFKGNEIALTQRQLFDLVNAPSNKKTPQTLADWAIRSGKEHGYKVDVFDKAEIEALGMHALLAVNRGSENPPTFIVMEYKPANTPIKKVGLVGKGVTFDTGGLSIKPSTNMHYMKSDMGGAAAVMGTMEMAAKLKLPIHLFGVVPATDNSVDAKSIKPGDVIGSYDGKTIEVIDTDAEGRLILADGLAYAVKNFQPDVLIDLATLTGSCIRTLGTYAGGLFSNDDNLIGQLMKASQLTGERLWPLPLWDDYKKEIKSDVADVKNFSGNPSAGAITAAKFLEIFIQGHPSWAHMDIAGVAVSDSEYSTQKSATAFGVRLLICYLESLLKPS
jgi:leucyl aminopeptidase